MMKHEFDELVGMETAPEAYKRIEYVYMNDDEFDTKQEIADFYKKHDMNGIERKYKEIIDRSTRTEEFKNFAYDLAFFSKDLVSPIKQHLAETAMEIFKNETIVKMLSEYRNRYAKEIEETARDFEMYTRDGIGGGNWNNNCLTHSGSYKDIIADLTYNKWWHENASKFN